MLPLIDLAMHQIRVGNLGAADNAITVIESQGGDCKTVAKLRGRMALRRHDWPSAFNLLQIALAEDGDDIDTLLLLGFATLEMGGFDQAAEYFRQVIRRNVGSATAWLKLGSCHALQQNHAEAMACVEHAACIAPDDAECQHGMGVICSTLGIDEGALYHFHRASVLQPGYAHAEAGEGATLLRMGRWQEGWPLWEARWRIPVPAAPWAYQGQPLYGGDLPSLRDKRVLVRSEQGFGDTIQFARYVEPLAWMAKSVTVEVPPSMERLFACLPAKVIVQGRDPVPDFDHQTSLMSLPLLFGTTPIKVPRPVAVLATPGFHVSNVGLCWAGGPRPEDPMANAVDQRRSMTRQQFQPIIDSLDGVFASLQREDMPISHYRDWQDTANLIAGLALVITVDTAIAHLAASLNVETWMLCRFDSCWRWGLTGERTPWYPSMRIFRQPMLGDWDSVIRRVAKELENT